MSILAPCCIRPSRLLKLPINIKESSLPFTRKEQKGALHCPTTPLSLGSDPSGLSTTMTMVRQKQSDTSPKAVCITLRLGGNRHRDDALCGGLIDRLDLGLNTTLLTNPCYAQHRFFSRSSASKSEPPELATAGTSLLSQP